MNKVLDAIHQHKIISIIRTDSSRDLVEVAGHLYRAGIRVLEVTMNTPGALKGIEQIKETYSDMWIGAGTVLDSETARLAILAGATFLLAPTLKQETIEMGNRYNVPVIPGVFTPTEVLTAYELGANVVKVFPVGSLGAKYIKELKGPLNQVEMIPVGGVTTETALDFLQAGSFALGVGSAIVSNKLVEEKKFTEIGKRAKQLIDIVKTFPSR
ncbi:bifunctional 4-hydroxy-2-oxoglutarate aldolase/2-dehydro-3-deoxy-phosphogluconate aldolase [Aquibacillus salsiterrae]|uniref:Bifunctional 4-hydroxy-2-oxoglutarate aldolase/2-dehydro-3-deoxy-phosphogluconate aldolase n=1 Tax=Aquibacillus salsiterrae TaxID=2950439 RepID=A0A9X3WBT1_9BACI|nr:bifunctional 4-hydroxy-2-oxoglutarate aldolase/2-dehydro-3-deoxy-phosphogluconate aldolase [Aquibacillus salsiterrae]MDC3415873.1 bifunctional 4-hydroxy-2-oxoglutarate aldolase/2-dehydro-3-deoxy-phosphogluconate aldolase [Aquibacillus salsiterrae]